LLRWKPMGDLWALRLVGGMSTVWVAVIAVGMSWGIWWAAAVLVAALALTAAVVLWDTRSRARWQRENPLPYRPRSGP
jgi:membrane protein implicated in regulation of membrane protease activity